MSALEVMHSIDSILADAKQKYEEEIKTLKDQLLASNLETEMHRALHSAATKERDAYMRLATKFVTQFGMVEKIFAEVKSMVLAQAAEEASPAAPIASTEPPSASLLPQPTPTEGTTPAVEPPHAKQ